MAQIQTVSDMDEKNYTNTIPGNVEGAVITAESSVETFDQEAARTLYTTAKSRLLNVNNWEQLAGKLMAGFQLTDAHGQDISGPAREGYYFRIDIPGPGTKAGDGYDWALVEEIEEYQSADVESVGIRVRPATNPAGDSKDTAHFYSRESTSTFYGYT